MSFKNGTTKAITDTTRKLATIVWNMITKKVPYQSKEYLFLDQKRKKITQIRKNIGKLGINQNDFGLCSL